MSNAAELFIEVAYKLELPEFCAELLLKTSKHEGFEIYNKLLHEESSIYPLLILMEDEFKRLPVDIFEVVEEDINPPTKKQFDKMANAHLFATMGDPRAINLLIEIIGDSGVNENIRKDASGHLRILLNNVFHESAFRLSKWKLITSERPTLQEEIACKKIESLIRLLKSDDPSVRRWTIFALGTRRDLHVVKSLIEMLYDKDFEVKRHAIIELGNIKNPIAVEHLITLLSGDNKKIRKYAAYALGVIRDYRAVESLIRSFENETELNVKLAMATIEALSRIGSQEAIEFINKLFEDNGRFNVAIRLSIAHALAIRGNQKAVEFLKGLLDNSKANIRRRAVQALVFTEDPTLVEPLIEFLKSDKWIGVHLDIVSLFQRYPDIVKKALKNAFNKRKVSKDAIKNVLRLANIRNPDAYLQYLLKKKTKNFSYTSFLSSDDMNKVSECCRANLKVGDESIAIVNGNNEKESIHALSCPSVAEAYWS